MLCSAMLYRIPFSIFISFHLLLLLLFLKLHKSCKWEHHKNEENKWIKFQLYRAAFCNDDSIWWRQTTRNDEKILFTRMGFLRFRNSATNECQILYCCYLNNFAQTNKFSLFICCCRFFSRILEFFFFFFLDIPQITMIWYDRVGYFYLLALYTIKYYTFTSAIWFSFSETRCICALMQINWIRR